MEKIDETTEPDSIESENQEKHDPPHESVSALCLMAVTKICQKGRVAHSIGPEGKASRPPRCRSFARQMSHTKKNFLLSIECWFFNRDPYFVGL